jgi:hypothetical protein
VLLTADRADLASGERLNALFEVLEKTLQSYPQHKDDLFAIKDIILELAANAVIHGKGTGSEPEYLAVTIYKLRVHIWLIGYGHPSQMKRLSHALTIIDSIAIPPHHEERLFARREASLRRRVGNEKSQKYGGGVGMLTIAALSHDKLWFKSDKLEPISKFALRSSI